MRLDKYIKTIGIIKRRTIAKDTIEHSKIRVNDVIAKPSYDVKTNDIIQVKLKEKTITIRVMTPILNYEILHEIIKP
jgi:ribosomal 50S subunit-recycling heat shock protein